MMSSLKLNKFGLAPKTLTNVYRCTIESIPYKPAAHQDPYKPTAHFIIQRHDKTLCNTVRYESQNIYCVFTVTVEFRSFKCLCFGA